MVQDPDHLLRVNQVNYKPNSPPRSGRFPPRPCAGPRISGAVPRCPAGVSEDQISAVRGPALGPLKCQYLALVFEYVIAYWCEGTKSKPYRMDQQVRFINSDPALIRLFLAFLDRAGVSRHRLRFCVHIHESADVEAATRYWARVTGAALDQFVRPVIKHHTPRRPRPSGNADYHGCLRVSVIKSSTLYREISGWAHGVMTARRRDPV